MSDERLRKLERAALSSPDDFEAFGRWRAELKRIQPCVYPNSHYAGIRQVALADTISGVYRVGEEALLIVDATAGGMSIILPKANAESYCRLCTIKKVDSSAHTVSVSGAEPTETIEGAQGHVLIMQYEVLSVACDGKVWWLVR